VRIAPAMTDRSLSVQTKLLATLWTLSTAESFRSIGDRFDMGKSTLHKVFKETCSALCGLWFLLSSFFIPLVCGESRTIVCPRGRHLHLSCQTRWWLRSATRSLRLRILGSGVHDHRVCQQTIGCTVLRGDHGAVVSAITDLHHIVVKNCNGGPGPFPSPGT